MRRHTPGHHPAVRLVVGAVLAGALLVGCTDSPDPAPSTSTSAPAPSSPTPEPPAEFMPDGSAEDNLPFFTSVVDGVWANGQPLEGRAYIDALAAGGFDKAAMQVTPDLTSLGGPVDTIQFSVLWGEQCLVGQIGPSTGDPVARVMPKVHGGACLVGQTRTIDW